LIKSKEDIDIFEGMKKLYFRILDLKDKYKENMDQLTEVIEEISNALRIIHNNSITKFQNIIKHTKIHEELIELMKHINCETYAPLFTLIKKVLYKFIYRNPANQALLLPHLKLLLSMCSQ
jgi:predicted house-cleaning noncanonical NTP pyrophosphatase (MazG superfamily)